MAPVTTTSVKEPVSEANWGDANTDGKVDVSDAVLIARYLVSDVTAVISDQGIRNSAVTNGTSVVSDDITKILRFIAKMINKDELAPSQPTAG